MIGIGYWCSVSPLSVLCSVVSTKPLGVTDLVMKNIRSNHFAGVAAGRTPEYIENNKVHANLKSGSTRLTDR